MSRVTTWARKLHLRSRRQKLVLMVIADHADVHTWTSIAGQDLIAKEAETSVRTVRTALAELEDLGVITRRRRYRRHGYRTSDAVTLNRFWRPVDPDDDTNQAEIAQDDTHPSPAKTAGNRTPADSYPQGTQDDGLTGNPRQAYRQRLPGYVSPGGSPDTPSLAFDVDLSSRAVFRRPDQRSRSRPPRAHPDVDARVLAACQILAARDLADRQRARLISVQQLGQVQHGWRWHAEATWRRLTHDGPALADLADQHPKAPARALVELLEPDEPAIAVDFDPWASTDTPAIVIDLRPASTVLAAELGAWNALRRARQEPA